MARSKLASGTKAVPLPTAPWIYVNDPTDSDVAAKLASLIPRSGCIDLPSAIDASSMVLSTLTASAHGDTVKILVHDHTDWEEAGKAVAVECLKTAAIKHGCNFVSVNLFRSKQSDKPARFGTNHLELKVTDDDDEKVLLGSEVVAEKIYKWLFSVLSVREGLHLIPDAQMLEIDRSTAYKEYQYCAIADARHQPRDAQVQFVALILSKPVVGANKRLTWQVADKTGTANFYFQWRGPSSQYTWDWVLALKPGDRKCLPRMPMTLIKEPMGKTIIKAPFRATAAVVAGTGCVVKGAGKGLMTVGRKIKLGDSSEWVPRADVVTDKKGRKVKRTTEEEAVVIKWADTKSEFKVFTEKGEKTWSDVDSVASTTAESISEKDPKQFA